MVFWSECVFRRDRWNADETGRPVGAQARGPGGGGSPHWRLIGSAPAIAILVVAVIPAAVGDTPAANPGHGDAHAQASAGPGSTSTALGRSAAATTAPPNIVFVLTDDLSMDLVQFMPQVQALEQQGVTFSNYFVTDSLCCPSRSSIFTGNFPHDTGVFTNTAPTAGSPLPLPRRGARHLTARCNRRLPDRDDGQVPERLPAPARSPTCRPTPFVPPGWDEWDVAGWGYPEYNYKLNENGTTVSYGNAPDGLPHRRAGGQGDQFIAQRPPAKPVLPRGGHLRAALPLTPRRSRTSTTSPA